MPRPSLSPNWSTILDASVLVMLTTKSESNCALDCWRVLEACDALVSLVQMDQGSAVAQALRNVARIQCDVYYFG